MCRNNSGRAELICFATDRDGWGKMDGEKDVSGCVLEKEYNHIYALVYITQSHAFTFYILL